MIVSNEPGYYKTGAYGIRIENLVAVVPRDAGAAERAMLGFETLTLAPIDLALVEPALLEPAETAWLDAYHARVRAELTPLVDAATAAWLAGATRPVGTDQGRTLIAVRPFSRAKRGQPLRRDRRGDCDIRRSRRRNRDWS